MPTHPNPTPLDIRPLAAAEVVVLERMMGHGVPAKHAARFALQVQGTAVYLVAWQHERPVGHVVLEWTGCQTEPMKTALPACPMASDLRVVAELRSHGIGSQLLAAMEEQARAAGYQRIGLAVAVDNSRARALYERQGYRDAGFAPYVNRSQGTNEHGTEVWYEERCVYLVRELPSA